MKNILYAKGPSKVNLNDKVLQIEKKALGKELLDIPSHLKGGQALLVQGSFEEINAAFLMHIIRKYQYSNRLLVIDNADRLTTTRSGLQEYPTFIDKRNTNRAQIKELVSEYTDQIIIWDDIFSSLQKSHLHDNSSYTWTEHIDKEYKEMRDICFQQNHLLLINSGNTGNRFLSQKYEDMIFAIVNYHVDEDKALQLEGVYKGNNASLKIESLNS